MTHEYLTELRQATLNELQGALERVQQLKGAIGMLDALIAQQCKDEESIKAGGTD
jgi:hypothetical protein